MKRTLVRHRRDAAALIVMTLIAAATLGYILSRQVAFTVPSWLPGGEEPYRVEVEFSSASGIIPGQAQPVTVAGVQVGDVGDLEIENGRAVVTLEIEPQYAPIYANATALLRPRTPLKEMFVALDPGTERAEPIPEGGRIPASQTKPDVAFDEVLANLDTDTRAYLKLLLVSGGAAFTDDPSHPPADGEPSPGAVTDLRATLKRFEPLIHHTNEIGAALGERRRNLQRVITSFGEIAERLASVDTDLATLISASNRTFAATASRDADLAEALEELPPTLAQTDSTVRKTTSFANQLGPTLASLRPFARSLGPTLDSLQPFLEQTTPIIRDQLRPFSRDVRPVVNDLRPAAASLAAALPPVNRVLGFFNDLFDSLAYNPKGPEEGYMFWGAWLSHIGPSLAGLQDSYGPALRGLPMATCAQLDALRQVELGNPSLSPVIKFLNLPDRTKLCPQSPILP